MADSPFIITGPMDTTGMGDGRLYWSNDDGWGYRSTATVFPPESVDRLPGATGREDVVCPDCGTPAMWCEEHQQPECAYGGCDHVGPIWLTDPKEDDNG